MTDGISLCSGVLPRIWRDCGTSNNHQNPPGLLPAANQPHRWTDHCSLHSI